MKILAVNSPWVGGLLSHIIAGMKSEDVNIQQIYPVHKKSLLNTLKLNNIIQVKNYLNKDKIKQFNESVLSLFHEFKPNFFLTMNENLLLPETIKLIQQENCNTVCLVSDNPFDSHRYIYFPISLQYYDKLLITEGIWLQNIRNIAPSSEIIKIPSGGGFSPDYFYPANNDNLTNKDIEALSCDISFTGESYSMQAEGGYRAGVFDQLGKYNMKIWGDNRWKQRFPYYNNLEKFYQGTRLSYEDLRKLYSLSTINLNLPSPQVFTGFQPRVFEIAACKGFQIVDWRKELDEYFNEDELVTFKNIPELIEKIEYFINNPDARKPYIEKAYKKVCENFTWDLTIKSIIKELF